LEEIGLSFPLPFQLKIVIGFLTLAIAAELISESAEKLSERFGQGFTGGIIVGLFTVLPETLFIIIAVLNGDNDVAIGSALGANVILFTFGIGLIGILHNLRWGRQGEINREYKIEEKYLLISNLALISVYVLGFLNVLISILMLIIYFLYVYERYKVYKSFKVSNRGRVRIRYFLYLTLGSLLIIIFGNEFIEGLNEVSKTFGISTSLISLILTPIAAELEEKLSSVRLVLKSPNNFTLAILSFIGSKIENTTILIAIIGLTSFNGIPIHVYYREFISTIITTFIALYVLLDRKMRLLESVTLILLYFLIITALVYIK